MLALKELIQRFCKELDLPVPEADAQKRILLPIGKQVSVLFSEMPGMISLHSKIIECPEKKREELFTYLMRANFLDQGTGGARIGLDADEKFLTLSLAISYEIDYRSFKECVEDFINHVIYWEDEIKQRDKES